MWWSDRRRFLLRGAALAALPLAAGGCGFTPLYGAASPARSLSGRIDVAPIDAGAFGFTLREALVTRLGPADAGASFRLEVDPSIEEEERAIRSDRSITRFNLTALAPLRVLPVSGGAPVLEATVRADTAYSALASPFAIRSAQADARRRLAVTLAERIILRLAATAGDWAT